LVLLFLAVVVLIAWGVAILMSRAASSVYDRVNPSSASSERRIGNPNANNPDALEADLDPEGDEPQGY
jgi:hypothetical protein